MTSGVLLLNLGTPDDPSVPAVRRYLREFLSDPQVIDIHPIARWLLVNAIIVPFRSPKSAHAYEKIWTSEGSPLRIHTEALAGTVSDMLGTSTKVSWGMRYGNPSIRKALEPLLGCGEICVLPLYPQYALSSTQSSIDAVNRELKTSGYQGKVRMIESFYEHPAFLNAWKEISLAELENFQPDHVLFSFHGLPERHIKKLDLSQAHCLKYPECCDVIGSVNSKCYRAQSFATARGIAKLMDIANSRYSVSFQSRLGRTPWIEPFTDLRIPELAKQGVKKLAVVCPSFVADCLETLEEIGIRGRDLFLEAGGGELKLIPCLNSHLAWAKAVVEILK